MGGQVGVEGVGREGEGSTLGRNIIQIDVYSTGSFAPELMGRRFMSYVNKLDTIYANTLLSVQNFNNKNAYLHDK